MNVAHADGLDDVATRHGQRLRAARWEAPGADEKKRGSFDPR